MNPQSVSIEKRTNISLRREVIVGNKAKNGHETILKIIPIALIQTFGFVINCIVSFAKVFLLCH